MLVRLTLAALLTLPAAAQAALPESIQKMLAEAKIPEENLAVLVQRGDSILLSNQADKPMQPASTMKLVTTLAGLELLGPVFKGRTELLSTGKVNKGVLQGDLILRGGADPDFDSAALEEMLQYLRNEGIQKISGKLQIDRSLWQPSRLDIGLAPFDESPEAYYNVIPDALLLNKNMIRLHMKSVDGKLKLAMSPALDRVSIQSAMSPVDVDCKKWEDGWRLPTVERGPKGQLKIVLHGTFPMNCSTSYGVNVLDKQDYVERALRTSWRKLGGTIGAETIEAITPPEAVVLAEHTARALPEIVRDTNKPSDNALARTILLSLGSLESDPKLGSHPLPASAEPTLERGANALRAWLRSRGIDDTGLIIDNGSGLSRTERITPQQMAGLLQAGLRSNWSPEFLASMPIVALDGTMRRRLRESPAAGRARMKTGTLKNVTALAGYVPDAKGERVIVSIMLNDDKAGNGVGRSILDALVDWVTRQP